MRTVLVAIVAVPVAVWGSWSWWAWRRDVLRHLRDIVDLLSKPERD